MKDKTTDLLILPAHDSLHSGIRVTLFHRNKSLDGFVVIGDAERRDSFVMGPSENIRILAANLNSIADSLDEENDASEEATK